MKNSLSKIIAACGVSAAIMGIIWDSYFSSAPLSPPSPRNRQLLSALLVFQKSKGSLNSLVTKVVKMRASEETVVIVIKSDTKSQPNDSFSRSKLLKELQDCAGEIVSELMENSLAAVALSCSSEDIPQVSALLSREYIPIIFQDPLVADKRDLARSIADGLHPKRVAIIE